MKTPEARRQLEKIQTLIENLQEGFPEGQAGEFNNLGKAYKELEDAGEAIDTAIDLLVDLLDGDDEEEED